jgi:hypothetical protein
MSTVETRSMSSRNEGKFCHKNVMDMNGPLARGFGMALKILLNGNGLSR